MSDRIFRPGDRVTVWGTVKATGSTGWMTIDFGDANRCPCVDPIRIATHEARAIAARDWVTTEYSTAPIQILFIHKGWAALPGIAAPWFHPLDKCTQVFP